MLSMQRMRQRLVINELSLLTVIDGLVIPPGTVAHTLTHIATRYVESDTIRCDTRVYAYCQRIGLTKQQLPPKHVSR